MGVVVTGSGTGAGAVVGSGAGVVVAGSGAGAAAIVGSGAGSVVAGSGAGASAGANSASATCIAGEVARWRISWRWRLARAVGFCTVCSASCSMCFAIISASSLLFLIWTSSILPDTSCSL